MVEQNISKGLAKRIIPCLDVKNGETVKGTNFVNLRSAGDPVELGKAYSDAGADELVFLDITASFEGRKTFADMVTRVAEQINIPFTVGGGINELKDVDRLLNAGADKVSINSAAIRNPRSHRRDSRTLWLSGVCMCHRRPARQRRMALLRKGEEEKEWNWDSSTGQRKLPTVVLAKFSSPAWTTMA